MSTWPPTVADLKADGGIPVDTDDAVLATELAAAVAFVRGQRRRFNYDADPTSTYPDPSDDVWLGTVRLAKRWHDRRRAAAGAIYSDAGASDSVPYVDPDICQLLGIGKWAPGAFA